MIAISSSSHLRMSQNRRDMEYLFFPSEKICFSHSLNLVNKSLGVGMSPITGDKSRQSVLTKAIFCAIQTFSSTPSAYGPVLAPLQIWRGSAVVTLERSGSAAPFQRAKRNGGECITAVRDRLGHAGSSEITRTASNKRACSRHGRLYDKDRGIPG